MKCRSCGLEIAEKAIVCYRCGTPTAEEAPTRPARVGRGARTYAGWTLVLLIIAVGAWWLTRPGVPARGWWFGLAAAGAAFVVWQIVRSRAPVRRP
jgi:hypothetical protein